MTAPAHKEGVGGRIAACNAYQTLRTRNVVENRGGRGHNVTALQLPDKRYAVVVSERVRFDREIQKIVKVKENELK